MKLSTTITLAIPLLALARPLDITKRSDHGLIQRMPPSRPPANIGSQQKGLRFRSPRPPPENIWDPPPSRYDDPKIKERMKQGRAEAYKKALEMMPKEELDGIAAPSDQPQVAQPQVAKPLEWDGRDAGPGEQPPENAFRWFNPSKAESPQQHPPDDLAGGGRGSQKGVRHGVPSAQSAVNTVALAEGANTEDDAAENPYYPVPALPPVLDSSAGSEGPPAAEQVKPRQQRRLSEGTEASRLSPNDERRRRNSDLGPRAL